MGFILLFLVSLKAFSRICRPVCMLSDDRMIINDDLGGTWEEQHLVWASDEVSILPLSLSPLSFHV